jgi:hypothetical protein
MYVVTQTHVNAKPLRGHDTLMLMKVDLIHKPGRDNVELDALSKRDEFQAMNTIQIL